MSAKKRCCNLYQNRDVSPLHSVCSLIMFHSFTVILHRLTQLLSFCSFMLFDDGRLCSFVLFADKYWYHIPIWTLLPYFRIHRIISGRRVSAFFYECSLKLRKGRLQLFRFLIPWRTNLISYYIQLLHTFIVDVLTYRWFSFLSFFIVSIVTMFKRSRFTLKLSFLSAIRHVHSILWAAENARCAVELNVAWCVLKRSRLGTVRYRRQSENPRMWFLADNLQCFLLTCLIQAWSEKKNLEVVIQCPLLPSHNLVVVV